MKSVILKMMLSLMVAISIIGFVACSETTLAPDKNYLSALEGLTVTTTSYHNEVWPPPPGSMYPPTFYDSTLIGKFPPDIKDSVTAAPYGETKDYEEVWIDQGWFREGQTLDILVEANKGVLWAIDKPDTVGIYAKTDTSSVMQGTMGLQALWGFFYENVMTEIQAGGSASQRRYSTALRIIVWEESDLRITFRNFSPEKAEVSYSIWRGGIVPNFSDDYDRAWEKYWISHGGYQTKKFLKLKADMEEYLIQRR